jgi:hypothetical protein
LLFALVVTLAAALRFAGLGWGLAGRTSFHPDEDKILWQLERMRLGALDLHPKDFGWGTLHTYVVGATVFGLDRAGLFGQDGWRAALRDRRTPYFARLILAGRAWSALLGLATVLLVFAIGRRLGGAGAAAWAAALLAVSPLHVAHSHYLTTDVAMGFWLSLALLLALRESQAGAGFVLGLAIATKPSAIALAPVVLLVGSRLGTLAALFAGFVAGEPYALLAFRDWSAANAAIVARIGSAARESFGVGELIARHAVQLALYGLGPVGAAAAVVGLRRGGRVLGLASAGLALTLPLSRFPMGRYELPLLPFLAVAAGLALANLRGAAARAVLLGALAPPLAYSLAADAALYGAHPYAGAGAFIELRSPLGASVARLWSEYPPLDAERYPPLLLADPFALRGEGYRALESDFVVLDDLPLHGWREELRADLAAHYAERRFEKPLPLPEPFAPHDSRYPRPSVTVYERLRPRSGVERDERVAGAAPGR